jgi:ABC-2 type transport system ATP-binding protein
VLRDVSLRYAGGPLVLDGLYLDARRGELMVLLGSNGAGKSSTFRIIAGLARAHSGSVEVAGVSVAEDRREASRNLGFVPDEPMLYPSLNALENLNLFALLWGVEGAVAKERAELSLRRAGLWQDRHAWSKTFSRGMRQKLSLCAALMHDPPILVLDEPFAGLDLEATLWLRELLAARARSGGCVLLSTHQPEAVDAFADRVAILHQGRIAADVDRAELKRRGGTTALFRAVVGGGA